MSFEDRDITLVLSTISELQKLGLMTTRVTVIGEKVNKPKRSQYRSVPAGTSVFFDNAVMVQASAKHTSLLETLQSLQGSRASATNALKMKTTGGTAARWTKTPSMCNLSYVICIIYRKEGLTC